MSHPIHPRHQRHKSEKPLTAKERKLKDLMLKSDNRICADCGAPDPKWASVNIGVFLCLKCSEVHKLLGESSKVLPVNLEEWSDNEIDSMLVVGGNSYANSTYEAFLPRDRPKLKPDSSHEDREIFIRAKYVTKEFMEPKNVSAKMSFRTESITFTENSLSSSTSRNDFHEDTREFVGMLKVSVVKGTHLAVRDILTSDPYVVLRLGHETFRTTVKKRNLNPVWNEVFMLSVPQHYGPLKIQVYDQDMFSADDIMGEAEVDLQPLVTAALAFGDPALLGDMQIGRWLKTSDNALVKDSTVNIAEGKVVQEVLLKLQNVESGELELHLEWIPLSE